MAYKLLILFCIYKYINKVDNISTVSEKREVYDNRKIFSGTYNRIIFNVYWLERMIMNKKSYLGLVLAACIGVVSAPLLAEVSPAPEQHPANITAPAKSAAEHQEAATLHKQHAEHENTMSVHFKSLAEEYKMLGNHELQKHYVAMAKHHEALAKEHEKTAAVHEKMAKPK